MRQIAYYLFAVASSGALLGCGSSSSTSGSASATGSFNGVALSFHAAASVVTSDSKGAFLEIALAKDADCADASIGLTKSDQLLTLALYTIDAGTSQSVAASSTGVYSLDVTGPGPYAEADLITTDASCMPQTQSTGAFATGTVTLTSLGDNAASGSLSLTAGSDTLTGTFDSEACPALGSGPGSGGTCH